MFLLRVLVFSLLAAAAAQGAPPPGLGHFAQLLETDDESVELTNFTARLLTRNLRTLEENLRVLDQAVDEVVIATFQWHNDLTGRASAWAAIRAVRRGVKVTAVVDALDMYKSDRRRLLMAMKREGIDVRFYRPLVASHVRANQRLHEKAVIAHAPGGVTRAIFGGRNKTDHYLIGDETYDCDVSIEIGRAQGTRLMRAQLDPLLADDATVEWEGEPGYGQAEHDRELAAMKESDVQVRGLIAADPAPRPREVPVRWGFFARNRARLATMTRAMELTIAAARKRLRLANAYFIPEDPARVLLENAVESGVDVATFTNSLASTPHTNVVRLMAQTIRGLLSRGMALFVRQPGELHAKVTEADGRVLIVSSTNLDGRSEFSDTQNGLLLDSPELAAEFNVDLARQVSEGAYQAADGRSVPGLGVFDRCVGLLLAPMRGLF